MKKKLPFVVNYTEEMSKEFNKKLMESGSCPMSNPKFYGKWDLVEFGCPKYNEKVKVKRVDFEETN